MKEKYGSQSKPSAQRPSRWHFILIALSPPTTAKQIYILKRKMSAGRWLEKEGREGRGKIFRETTAGLPRRHKSSFSRGSQPASANDVVGIGNGDGATTS